MLGDLVHEMRVEIRAAWQEAVGDPRDDEPVTIGYRGMLVLLLLLGSAAAVFGLADETDGFLGNAIAEVSGVTLGAVLAVTLIERVIARQRTERWSPVREEIRRAVCSQVVAMAIDFHMATPQPGRLLETLDARYAVERAEVADAMSEVADALDAAIPQLASAIEPDLASSRSLHTSIELSFEPIRDLLTTRVVVLGDEPDLVRRLMALEHHERRWRFSIHGVERFGAPDSHGWEPASSMLRAGIEAYRYFLRNP